MLSPREEKEHDDAIIAALKESCEMHPNLNRQQKTILICSAFLAAAIVAEHLGRLPLALRCTELVKAAAANAARTTE